jgi:hypothetical protein
VETGLRTVRERRPNFSGWVKSAGIKAFLVGFTHPTIILPK